MEVCQSVIERTEGLQSNLFSIRDNNIKLNWENIKPSKIENEKLKFANQTGYDKNFIAQSKKSKHAVSELNVTIKNQNLNLNDGFRQREN